MTDRRIAHPALAVTLEAHTSDPVAAALAMANTAIHAHDANFAASMVEIACCAFDDATGGVEDYPTEITTMVARVEAAMEGQFD